MTLDPIGTLIGSSPDEVAESEASGGYQAVDDEAHVYHRGILSGGQTLTVQPQFEHRQPPANGRAVVWKMPQKMTTASLTTRT